MKSLSVYVDKCASCYMVTHMCAQRSTHRGRWRLRPLVHQPAERSSSPDWVSVRTLAGLGVS